MLLEHGELGQDPPRLADVGALARPSSVPTRSGRSFRPFQPGPPSGRGHSVWSQYSSDRLSCLARATCCAASLGRDPGADDRAEQVVVLRPVDQRDPRAAGIRAGLEVARVEDPPVDPQAGSRAAGVEAAG